VNRREFIATGLLALPALRACGAADAASPLALATADTESHVAVVSPLSGRVVQRLRTLEGPRSIEGRAGVVAVCAHTKLGKVSLIEREGNRVRVRRMLGGFSEPRYTALAGRYAFVTDSGSGEVATIDLERGRVVHRAAVGDLARHVTRRGSTLWVALGSSAARIVAVDVGDPLRPRVVRHLAPRFLAHDVAVAPDGRLWITAGRERRIALHGGAELAADEAPQHVTFATDRAFVASGDGGTVRVHGLDGRLLRIARVPRGSYNVQRAGRFVLTPSLGTGTLTVLDARGRVLRSVHVAAAAHDACVL
jgi:DNA-binding beta-propeller fold protein YncE